MGMLVSGRRPISVMKVVMWSLGVTSYIRLSSPRVLWSFQSPRMGGLWPTTSSSLASPVNRRGWGGGGGVIKHWLQGRTITGHLTDHCLDLYNQGDVGVGRWGDLYNLQLNPPFFTQSSDGILQHKKMLLLGALP